MTQLLKLSESAMSIDFKSVLNPEQYDIVTANEDLLVNACPGSGKTRALVYKIAYEAMRSLDSNKTIIAFTYTNIAASEIKARLVGFGLDLSKVWIGTIHAFCLEWILRSFHIYDERIASGFKVIKQRQCGELLKSIIIKKVLKSKVSHFDCEYYFTENGIVLGCHEARKHSDINAVISDFHAELKGMQMIDHELTLKIAYDLLEKFPQISKILSMRTSYVMLDEYQDTKSIQYAIIGKIVSSSPLSIRMFAVGDPNQAIYSGIGAAPITAAQLGKLCGKNILERSLTNNYRSSGSIIDFFQKFDSLKRTLSAQSSISLYPSKIEHICSIGSNDLPTKINEIINYNIATLKIPIEEICILAPQWNHIIQFARAAKSSNFSHKLNLDLASPIGSDPENPWINLSKLIFTKSNPSIFNKRRWWADKFIDYITSLGIISDEPMTSDLLKICNSYNSPEESGLKFLKEGMQYVCSRLNLPIQVQSKLQVEIDQIINDADHKSSELNSRYGYAIISTDDYRSIYSDSSHGVNISTNHGAKGTEYDTIIAFGLLENYVPHWTSNNKIESARKLLYVISSRARKNLYLISENDRVFGHSNERLEPTRVLCTYTNGIIQ